MLATVCRTTGWEWSTRWDVDDAQGRPGLLWFADVWHAPGAQFDAFEAVSRAARFAPDVGFPGRTWSSARTAWIADVTADATSPGATRRPRWGCAARWP